MPLAECKEIFYNHGTENNKFNISAVIDREIFTNSQFNLLTITEIHSVIEI